MEAHLHEQFDHSVGRLSDTSATEETPSAQEPGEEKPLVPATAAEIRDIFSDPTRIRQAVVLSEIINRPEGRW